MFIQNDGDDVTSKEAKMYIFPAARWLTADALFVADFMTESQACLLFSVCRYL